MGTRMQQRRGTAAEWAAENPILADGEIGFERDTKIIKLGDGVTPWNELLNAYLSLSGGVLTGPLTLVAPTLPNHAARLADLPSGAPPSSVSPDADKLVLRDANGRSQVAAPAVAEDIARKSTVDDHAALTNPHSSTSLATASRLVLRDANGRSRFATPSDPADAATKGYVDAAVVPSSMVRIAQVLLGSVASMIDFTSIPAIYERLVLAFQVRSTIAATVAPILMRFNADSAGNYGWQRHDLFGTTTSGRQASSATSMDVGFAVANDYGATKATIGHLEIINYARTTFHKQFLGHVAALPGGGTGGSDDRQAFSEGQWNSTAVINRVQIFPSTGNFAIGSVFNLYGVV